MRNRLSTSARAYIVVISGAAVAAAAVLIAASLPAAAPGSVLIITLLGAAAHAFPIQGFRHQAYQVTLPFIVLAAATFNGIELVAFILVIHAVEQFRVRRHLHIQWFNACDYLLSAALALVMFHQATALLPGGAVGQLTAALAAACCFILANRLLLAGVLWLGRGLTPAASGLFQSELLAADLVIAWVAGPMLVLAIQAGSWTVLVTAGPLLLARPALSLLLGRQRPVSRRAEAA